MDDNGRAPPSTGSKRTTKRDAQRCAAAERMRLSRRRRRDGLRVVPLQIRDGEIEALVARGMLDPVARHDRAAIAGALGDLLDAVPPEQWGAPPWR